MYKYNDNVNRVWDRMNIAEAWKWGVDPDRTGERLRHLRLRENLTQMDLEDILEKIEPVTRVSISNWERGKSIPSVQHLLVLSKVYDVSVDALLVTREADDAA